MNTKWYITKGDTKSTSVYTMIMLQYTCYSYLNFF